MTTSSNTVLLASAGTGKTHELTVRIIALLAEGADPGSILATTFTRKAAGQILGRAFELLGRAADSPAELRSLGQQIGSTLTRDRCIALAALLARNIHRFGVMTIDAFFARLATRFSLESGLGPRWSIAGEDELDQLEAEAVTDALSRPIPDPTTGEDQRLNLALALHQGLADRTVHADVLKAVTRAASILDGPVAPGAWSAIGPESPPLDGPAILAAIAAVEALAPPQTKDGRPRTHWVKARAQIIDRARRGDWKGLVESSLVARIAEGAPAFDRVDIPQAYRDAVLPLITHAASVEAVRLQARNIATGALLARYDESLQRRKDSDGRYAFDDLPRRLLAAEAIERLSDLYYRLDASIRHLLLDEFQDTSVIQFRLIEPIIEELVSTSGGSIFCVGDPKQSLYSWRGGRAELLQSLKPRWPQFHTRDLSVNRRSAPPVIDAVNVVFGGLRANVALAGHGPAAEAWSGRFLSHEAHQKALTGLVSLWQLPAPDDPEADAPDTYAFAAGRAKHLTENYPDFSIGILVRTNKVIPHLLRELQALGIAASDEAGVPLLASPAAASALALLHLADHPGDTAALFLVATSPLGLATGLTDHRDRRAARRIASKLRRELLHDGYAATLSRLLHKIAGDLDAVSFDRFDRLIDLAHQFDEQGAGLRPGEFVRRARAASIRDSSADRVRILTIHSAKGLEFDAVILPELGDKWVVKPNTLLVDRRGPDGKPDPLGAVVAVTSSGNKDLRRTHRPLAELFRRVENQQVEESLCALYVAMTRAKRILEMITPSEPPSAPSAAAVLRQALAPNAVPAPNGLLWSTGQAPVPEPARPSPPSPAPVTIVLAPQAPPPPHRWASRAPSTLSGRVRLADLFAPRSGSLDFGTLIHAWFEQVGWLDDGEPADEVLLNLPATFELASLQPEQHLSAFRRALGPASRLGRLLTRAEYARRPADELKLYREWGFTVPGSRPGAILTGRFDRVVIGVCSGKPAWAEVIDFKTDTVPAGRGAVRSAAAHHRRQMLAYRHALSILSGLNAADITVVLAFTGPERVIRFRTRAHAAP